MTVAVFPPALLRQVQDRIWARLSPEQIQERVHNQLRQAELPLAYQRCTFDTLDPGQDPEAHRVCRVYAEQGEYQGKKGLILAGPPGNGKTSLAIALLRRTVEQTQGRYSARFWNVPTGLAQLRQQIDTPDPQADSILSLTHNRLLVLDDLGKQKRSEWVGEQFYLLLNTLCAQKKQVIITTNLALSRLFQGLDPALVSRLTNLCQPVALKGADRRR